MVTKSDFDPKGHFRLLERVIYDLKTLLNSWFGARV